MDDPNYGMDGPNYDVDNLNFGMDGPNYGLPSFFVCVSVLRLLGGLRRLASVKPKRKKENVGGRLTIINGSLYCH